MPRRATPPTTPTRPNSSQPTRRPESVRGVAFSNRTFRFLAEPRYPSGVQDSPPPAFSILNDPGVNPLTAENLGAPVAASAMNTVLGHDAFHAMANFRDPGFAGVTASPSTPAGINTTAANENGVVFFPGSTPVYRAGATLIGGLGVSGDGVDQDDVVTYLAAQGYLPNGTTVPRADEAFVSGVRLPFQKFLRNPFSISHFPFVKTPRACPPNPRSNLPPPDLPAPCRKRRLARRHL